MGSVVVESPVEMELGGDVVDGLVAISTRTSFTTMASNFCNCLLSRQLLKLALPTVIVTAGLVS